MQIVGRAVFEGFSLWMKVLFYVLALGASAVFLYGVFRRVQKYRRGRPDARFERLPARIWKALTRVATSKTIKKRDTYAGVTHALIAWGWMVLFVGTVLIMIDSDVLEIIKPEWRFLHGGFYLGYSLTLDVFGVLFLVGLGMMRYRRSVQKPAKLDYTRVDKPADQYDRNDYMAADGWFLTILGGIAITGFLSEGVRIAQELPGFEVWSPVGYSLALLLRAIGIQGGVAGNLHTVLWWVHALTVVSLIAYMPFSKALHMFTDFGNLTFQDDLAARRLPPAVEGDGYMGIRTLADLSWKQHLDLDACTKCGRCHSVCPARGSGAPLSPRDLILDLKEYADASFGMRLAPMGPSLAAAGLTGVALADQAPEGFSIAGGVISADTLWSCTTCRACVSECPVGIDHVGTIVQLRRNLVDQGEMDENLQSTLMKISRQGNSFGQPGRNRSKWAKDLPFVVKDARKEPVDYLWFVGDYASYDPRLTDVTRGVARVFHAAGVDFGLLHEGEQNSGNDVRRVGEEGLFDLLVEKNTEQFNKADFRRIVTTDPHSYNALRFEYPARGAVYDVQHYTEVLADLIDSGRLVFPQKLGYKVTYHDPCYLGRYGGVFDAPRRILEAMGCELVEMPRCRENSYCCGAGGGRIWMGDSLYPAEKPAENRIREAVALEGVTHFMVACPKDMAMYSDAVKTTGFEGRIQVLDIIQLVEQAVAAKESVGAVI